MATINRGILDGFFGKVGTVIGSFWKGIPVMRAYVRRIHDPKNSAQRQIRARFRAIIDLSSAFLAALRIGFKNVAASNHVTEGNVFTSKNWDAVHTDGGGSVTIDYSALVVSEGPLPEVLFGAPQFDNPLEVDVAFAANADSPKASADDDVFVFVYCPDARGGVLSSAVKRSVESVSVNVPAYWNGMKVHVWGFARGTAEDNKGLVSDSTYIGTGNIG